MSTTPSDLPALPEGLTQHVGFLSVVMGQRSQEYFEAAMATLDLRPVHYDYLATLAELGPMAQKDLARLIDLDAARIVSLTDELQQRALVERTVDARDRRRNVLTLTRDGRTLVNRAQKLSASVEADLLSGLTDAEGIRLRQLLRKALGLT